MTALEKVEKPSKEAVVLFLGNARPSEYAYFKENKLSIALLHDKHCPISYPPEGDFVRVITTDSTPEALFGAFQQLQTGYVVTAQIAAVETAVLDNALLATKTGLPAPSVGAAQIALRKPEMRKFFEQCLGPKSTSASALIRDENELTAFSSGNGYPIILKPTNLFGSMFVTKSHTLDELVKNYNWMTREIRQHLDDNGRACEAVEVQAETYLDGSSHSIDCIVDGDGVAVPTEVVDVLTERDFGVDKVQHFARFSPSLLSSEKQEECKAFAGRAVRALGLKYCVAHVEFIYTKDGPKLLEIAARPGGNRVHLMKEVFGIDIMAAYHAALMVRPINTQPKMVKPRAIVSIYPEARGTFNQVQNVQGIRSLPGYVRHGVRVAAGEIVGPASAGFLPTLSVELARSGIAELVASINAVRELGQLIALAE